MSEMSISFDVDDDGFLSQECPSCVRRFKVKFTEGDGEGNGPLGHCPYCGYHGQECWWTPEQAQYIQDSVAAPFEDEMARMANDFNRRQRGGFIKMEMKGPARRPGPIQPQELNEPMPLFVFPCHNEPVKHDGSKRELHCVICGQRQRVEQGQ